MTGGLRSVLEPAGVRRRRPWRLVTVAAFAVVALAAGLVAYGLIEARRLGVVRYRVVSADLPPAFEGLEIALLTDIHRGPFYSQGRLDELVDRVNALDVDLIILGGDYVFRDASVVPSTFDSLGRLAAPLGVYGVLGNHDHYKGAGRAREAMVGAGIQNLDNRAVWLTRGSSRIRLGGVDDFTEGTADVDPTLAETAADDFVLLVSHQPDLVPLLPPGTVDLVLSGHTHGGQATVFGRWAPVIPSEHGQRYRTGLVDDGPAPVIVSNGIGTIVLPLRLWAPAQLVVVRLQRA